jgi:hypothetical protein
LLFLVWCPVASAAGDIVLRSAVEPAEAWIGQRVVLQIDVLGADGWAQISRFGDLDLPGAYLIRTDSQGTRLQEIIDGVAYTGQRYEVSIYPQRPGAIEVPAIPVEVTIKAWGAEASQRVQQGQAPAVTIQARLPPGAEGVGGLVSTTQLSANQQWNPVNGASKVGDALQRTVTLQAEDVSGMAFAPLAYADLPGVGIYPAGPEVSDSADRGSLSGRRSETVTYVFERAGAVQIPDIQLTWWNVSTEELETITLPGRELEIAPGPVGSAGASGVSASGPFSARDLWLSMAVLAVALVLLLRLGRPLLRRWGAWRRRRRDSEARYFRHALGSVRSQDARRALRDVMRWVDRINPTAQPAQLRDFVRAFGDAGAEEAFDRLLRDTAAHGRVSDTEAVVSALKAGRREWMEAGRRKRIPSRVLPELNQGCGITVSRPAWRET